MFTRLNLRGSRTAASLIVGVALAISMLVLMGCQAEEPAAPVEEGPKLASASAEVSGELDASHPKELPLWEGATVVSSALTGETVYELELNTTDPYDDVVYGVGKGLEGEGFTVEALDESPEVTILMSIKGDLGALYTIAPAEAGAGAVIGISVQLPAAE